MFWAQWGATLPVMKRLFSVLLLPTLLLLGQAPDKETEKKVKMKDLPAAVQQAVKEQSQGATLRGLSQEVKDGKTLYEAELRIAGRTKDVTFDTDGKVVAVEQEVALSSIPAPAREAIQKAVGSSKLLLVETVTESGGTFYEAHWKKGGKELEVKVDAAGKPVQ